MDLLVSGPEPAPRRPPWPVAPAGLLPTAPVLAGLVVAGLVLAGLVLLGRDEPAPPLLSVTGAVPAPPAGGSGSVQDAVALLTVRNRGSSAVRLTGQQLDGGGPLDDPAVSLPAGGSAVLAVRWRVLCDEVGGLHGPAALDLATLSQDRTGVVRLPLGGPSSDERRAFRSAAGRACAMLVR